RTGVVVKRVPTGAAPGCPRRDPGSRIGPTVWCARPRRRGSCRRPRGDAMPEAENRALFQRYFDEAANGGNLDLLDEIFATDYLHHDPANPDPRPVVGPQGVRDHLVSLMGAFPDLKFEIDDTVAQDESIVVRWTARGTNTGDYF